MIWSVSTLLRRSGTPVPVWVVNFSMVISSGLLQDVQVGGAGQRAAHGGGRRDEWADQVGAPALALAPLEVAVARRGGTLARREDVGVHAQAHRAAGEAPLGPRLEEDLVQALLLGLQAHPGRSRHDEHAHAVGDPATTHDPGRRAQVLDAPV